MQDSAPFYQNELQLMGEENGSGGYFLDLGSGTNPDLHGERNLGAAGPRINSSRARFYQHFFGFELFP